MNIFNIKKEKILLVDDTDKVIVNAIMDGFSALKIKPCLGFENTRNEILKM